ncbi:hypothetical protein F4703DRAFT_1907875 [Phycomyces blakesleeanus]
MAASRLSRVFSQRLGSKYNLPRSVGHFNSRHLTSSANPNPNPNPNLSKDNLTRATIAAGVLGSTGGLAYYLLQDDDDEEFESHTIVPDSAIYPPTGGPKDLPVASHYLDETEDMVNKPRLVIVGGGWGAVSIMKSLEKDKYNVTVVSENNYFLFTPLLPSATVGTLEMRSLVEPLRKIASRIHAHFFEGQAVDVDVENNLLEVKGRGSDETFYIPYDKLVVAVGATSITHGVEGLDNTVSLKTIQDAIDIRRRVTTNIEKACLPTTSPEERKRLLSFVICGGGPTGVEFAAELLDWVSEDFVKWFPKLIREEINVSIIQSRDHILNTFDVQISNYAEKRFNRKHIKVITNARVQRIEDGKVIYKQKSSDNTTEDVEIPFGLCLWSTGIAMTPFAKKITDKLPEQAHQRALTTDGYLRLRGTDNIFALGDCASIENPKLIEHLMEIFEMADQNRDGSLTKSEFGLCIDHMRKKFPLTEQHLENVKELFDVYDTDKNGTLEIEEMRNMLTSVDSKMTNLPATAQVANQQGRYLGRYLSALAEKDSALASQIVGPFHYSHMGALAYLGNTAVGEFNKGFKMIGGLWALYLWRSVYWSEQVSARTRVNLSIDWTKRAIWGRDISTV